uniref:Phosphatidylcholine transfer protein n=1 Tax=Ciona savignyi TaxID=51511 RepID=H2YWB0_CIOSA
MNIFNPSLRKTVCTLSKYKNSRVKLTNNNWTTQINDLHCMLRYGFKHRLRNETSFFQTLLNNFKIRLDKVKCKHQYRWHQWTNQNKLVESLYQYLYPKRPAYFLAGAVCSFSWDRNGISDAELEAHVDELNFLKNGSFEKEKSSSYCSNEIENEFSTPQHWEMILNKPDIKIWRFPYKDTQFMQYKVFGRFKDVSARQFFTIQVDDNYRRKWDDHVLSINTVEENQAKGEIVVQWISHFPYPFNPREYVYVRRAKIDKDRNALVIVSRSIEHSKCPVNSKYVRVPLYISNMVIKPHKSMDEPGLDYLLTYCDNPQTSIPNSLSSWVITSGIPEYVEKLHLAAIKLNRQQSPKLTNFPDIGYEMARFDSRRIETA